MDVLRSASFGTLFGVTFAVGAAFQFAFGLLGVVLAVASPTFFKMNGAPASGPGQALGVLVFMLIVGLLMNTTIAAAGSGVWLGVRRWVLRGEAAPSGT